MSPFDDVSILPIIYRKSWHFQHFDLLSKCIHISPSTATSSDCNSNQVHPDTQTRSGCVEMIYPCVMTYGDIGVSRGGSKCCECCGTHTGIYLWPLPCWIYSIRITLSNGNIFRVTGPLCREFSGHRGIPVTNASDAELWCFLLSAPE